jgi:hypothetical protein
MFHRRLREQLTQALFRALLSNYPHRRQEMDLVSLSLAYVEKRLSNIPIT